MSYTKSLRFFQAFSFPQMKKLLELKKKNVKKSFIENALTKSYIYLYYTNNSVFSLF